MHELPEHGSTLACVRRSRDEQSGRMIEQVKMKMKMKMNLFWAANLLIEGDEMQLGIDFSTTVISPHQCPWGMSCELEKN